MNPEVTPPEENRANKKNKWAKKFAYLLILILAVLATFLMTSSYYRGASSSLLSSITSSGGQMQTIQEVYHILGTGYFGDLKEEDLLDGALTGMIEAVDDPYTEYYPEDETEEIDAATSGSFEGIGAEVMKEGDYVKIVAPLAESPAEKAGLQPNDIIIAVDGESVSGQNLSEVVSKIRGEKGSEVVITIRRADQESDISVIRDSIPIETVVYEKDANHPDIGHIDIRSFSQATYQDLVDAIQDLESQGIEKIVFDVRKNPGGLLDVAVSISNIFLEDGQKIMSIEDAEGHVETYTAGPDHGDFKYEGEAVLLIDEGSASASEILAGAMQAADIPIIGRSSFGKGLVQTVLELSNQGELKFTTARWLTASDEWIHEKGITPDQKVDMPDYADLLLIDSSQTYEAGQRSDEVKNINAILKALGYDVNQDDFYSDKSKQAIEEFQAQHGLDIDGKVTGSTANKLNEEMKKKIEDNDLQYEAAIEALLD